MVLVLLNCIYSERIIGLGKYTTVMTKEYAAKRVLLKNVEGDFLIPYVDFAKTHVDENTVNYNKDDKIQAVGNIVENSTYQNYWEGTKAEYNAIAEKNPNTLYQVTDDLVDVVTEIPTATSDDIGLVKPDNTTITVDDTGALHVPLSTKADTNLANVTARYDWITTRVLYNNGESGYEMSRLNWLRQWGKVTSSTNGEIEFNLHQPYLNTDFSIFAQVHELGNYFVSCYPSGNQKFKLRVQSSSGYNMAVRVSWVAYGRYS